MRAQKTKEIRGPWKFKSWNDFFSDCCTSNDMSFFQHTSPKNNFIISLILLSRKKVFKAVIQVNQYSRNTISQKINVFLVVLKNLVKSMRVNKIRANWLSLGRLLMTGIQIIHTWGHFSPNRLRPRGRYDLHLQLWHHNYPFWVWCRNAVEIWYDANKFWVPALLYVWVD